MLVSLDLLDNGLVSAEQQDVTNEQVDPYPPGQFDYFQEVIGNQGAMPRFS